MSAWRARVGAVLLAGVAVSAGAVAPAQAAGTWTAVSGITVIDVPPSTGVVVDAAPARAGLQTAVRVLTDRVAGRLRVSTIRGRVLAEGPTGGAVPARVLGAGWRVFVLGSGPRLWTPAFDPGRTFATVAPPLPCVPFAGAATPLAGPFDISIPAGARPGGRTVPSPVAALVFGGAGRVRIATPAGDLLGRSGPASVPQGGFAFAGAVFAYGTAAGRPALWTPALTGPSTTLVRARFASCIDVAAPVSVTVSPATAALTAGQTAQFTATVTGTANTAVTWTATGGTITPGGLYTAGPTGGSFSVTATSVADPTASATVPVAVQGARILSGAVTQEFSAPGGGSIGGFSGFVRVAVRPDRSVTVLDATGSSSATGLHECGTNTIATTVDGGGRYLPAPNAYSTTLDVLELSGTETSTFWFVDEDSRCQTQTFTDDTDTAEALYARRVVENGEVVAITFELEPPFDYQTGRLLPE
jgi:hypothetical protein